jgi:hypothetical protein
LLSPTPAKLAALRPKWIEEIKKAGLTAAKGRPDGPAGLEIMGGIDVNKLANGPFKDDSTLPNGSSIALLAEFGGKKVVLGADAHCDVLGASLAKLANGAKLKLDAFKIAHHGSAHNVSKAVLDAVDCDTYLFSTNGSYFNHPDPSAVSRVIRFGGPNPKLHFNYRSDETGVWDDAAMRSQFGYTTTYPDAATNGVLAVNL